MDVNIKQKPAAGLGDFERLQIWASRSQRRRALIGLPFVIIISLIATALILEQGATGLWRYVFGVLFLIDFTLIVIFGAVLMLEIVSLLRRRRQSGALQRRLVIFFLLMALVPTLIVAVFSALTVNFSIDGWFSGQIRNTVNSSYDTAIAYQNEHSEALLRDGSKIYWDIIAEIERTDDYSIGKIRETLTAAVRQVPNVSNAFIINGDADLVARGEESYKFNFVEPTQRELAKAFAGEIVIIEDWSNNQFRFLQSIEPLGQNRYLYLTRPVDGKILALLDQTEETVTFYNSLDQDRLRFILLYGLLFCIVALVTIAFAISAAIYLADRLTRPIHQLVHAASRVSQGELDVKVPVSSTDDELSVLSRSFNDMTSDVREKRDEILRAGETSEKERLRFNSVLEGVSSGVIGLDKDNKITFINPAALRILAIGKRQAKHIESAAAEFMPLINEARLAHNQILQSQISIIRNNTQETLFVRVAPRNENEGLIISFDDVSNLIQAQRMAAWGDVARRIAHEIKNPLTPIRLSAERMQRRFGDEVNDEQFSQMTQIIIRQTEDLRRIVDEFSKFSRMPDPQMQLGDFVLVIKESIALRDQMEDLDINYEGEKSAEALFDKTLMGQVFNNLIKNAAEAIESRQATEAELKGEIRIRTKKTKQNGTPYLRVEIIDNGTGLPADKTRLFEPYVTFKDSGTGLGLPIVNKIIDDHGGLLTLEDRSDGEMGAAAIIMFPINKTKQK